jgi:hypothetical protein
MKLKHFLTQIDDLITRHPELLDAEVVYAVDDEGNRFEPVVHPPSFGEFDASFGEFNEKTGEFEICETKIPAVCIN